MGLGEKMNLNEEITRHLRENNLNSVRKHSPEEFKSAIRRLIDEGRLEVFKTDGCPSLTPFFWYMGDFKIGEKTIKSSGEAFVSEMAQLRCIGEIFERIPLYDQEMSCKVLSKGQLTSKDRHDISASNGLSFALDLSTGIFNSYRELVERHVVLDYWLSKKNCQKIGGFDGMTWTARFSAWANSLRSNFYYFPNDYGMAVICCHIKRSAQPPYNIFGYGCHPNIESAMEKAYLEAWRFYWEYQKLENTEQFKNNEVKGFIDHFYAYTFNKDMEQAFFPEKSISVRKINTIERSRKPFRYDKMTIFNLKKYNLPGYSVQLQRDDFLPFKPGSLEENTKERKRGEIHPVA